MKAPKVELVRCPDCGEEMFSKDFGGFKCPDCGRVANVTAWWSDPEGNG